MTVPGAVTDPTRITTSIEAVESDGASLDAFLARPVGTSARGGVIVLHEAFGLVEHVQDVARRLAHVGFDALAPDLYARIGSPDPDDLPSVMEKMLGLPDEQVVADLEAAAGFLRTLEHADGTVGCIGFCSGGRQALLFGCSSPVPDAVVSCWGGYIDRATPDAETTDERPVPVIDLAPQLSCPLLAVGGAEDQNPSPDVLDELERRLHAAGKEATVRIFEGAGHAFFADHRETYRDRPAHELWPEIVSFFGTYLGTVESGA